MTAAELARELGCSVDDIREALSRLTPKPVTGDQQLSVVLERAARNRLRDGAPAVVGHDAAPTERPDATPVIDVRDAAPATEADRTTRARERVGAGPASGPVPVDPDRTTRAGDRAGTPPPDAGPDATTRAGAAPRDDGSRTSRGPDIDGAVATVPPTLRARFDIEPPIANGAEGTLFPATRRGDPHRYLLKVYRPDIVLDHKVYATLNDADRDHVVGLADSGRVEGQFFELLERVEGGTLRTAIPRGTATEAVMRSILAELAGAITYLHSRGIIHRDLKPDNILVRRLSPLDLVLGDFGLATLTPDDIELVNAHRTPMYAAPEAAHKLVWGTLDWWSLGMILLEWMTGKHPFDGADPTSIGKQLAQKREIDVGDVTDLRWRRLIEGLLTKSYDERWGSAQVTAWLDGENPPVLRVTAAIDYLGTPCETPEDLANALAANWEQAARDLNGAAGAKLEEFLVRSMGIRATQIFDELRASGLSPDAKVARLLGVLDPSLPPVYKSVLVDRAGLIEIARGASNDPHSKEAALVRDLSTSGVLEVLGAAPGRDDLRLIAARWGEAAAEFDRVRATLGGRLTVSSGDTGVRGLLLQAACDEVDAVRDRAHTASTTAARKQRWFRDLGSPDRASAGTLVAIICAAPLAEDEERTRREHASAERVAARRSRMASVLERTPRTRNALIVVTLVNVLFAAVTIALSSVRVPLEFRDIVRTNLSLRDFVVGEAPAGIDTLVRLTTSPVIAVLMSVVGVVLAVVAPGARRVAAAATEPTVKVVAVPWLRPAMQLYIGMSAVLRPVLLPPTLWWWGKGFSAAPGAHAPMHRGLRLRGFAAGAVMILYGVGGFAISWWRSVTSSVALWPGWLLDLRMNLSLLTSPYDRRGVLLVVLLAAIGGGAYTIWLASRSYTPLPDGDRRRLERLGWAGPVVALAFVLSIAS